MDFVPTPTVFFTKKSRGEGFFYVFFCDHAKYPFSDIASRLSFGVLLHWTVSELRQQAFMTLYFLLYLTRCSNWSENRHLCDQFWPRVRHWHGKYSSCKSEVKDDANSSKKINWCFPRAGPCSYVLGKSLVSNEFATLTILHLAKSIFCPAPPTYSHMKHIGSILPSHPPNTSFKLQLGSLSSVKLFLTLAFTFCQHLTHISINWSCEDSLMLGTFSQATGGVIQVCALQTGHIHWGHGLTRVMQTIWQKSRHHFWNWSFYRCEQGRALEQIQGMQQCTAVLARGWLMSHLQGLPFLPFSLAIKAENAVKSWGRRPHPNGLPNQYMLSIRNLNNYHVEKQRGYYLLSMPGSY